MLENWSFITSVKPFLQKAWEKSGFEKPTAIQMKAAPLVLEGVDIIAESPTGTGKTLAYLLPLLEQIDPEAKGTRAIILAPSRELVMQIYEQVQKWTENSGIGKASFIGGANVKRQIEKLKKRPQIVVGTPGRVLELIRLKKLKMHEVKSIVMDEGDQLLVPEHMNTIKDIIKATLRDRQLLVFSATLPEKTEQQARELSENAELIRIGRGKANESNTRHNYVVCDAREKVDILGKIMRLEPEKVLVFVRDIGNLSVLSEKLKYKGFSLDVLHSEAKKTDRAAALKNFREGKCSLLITTDVAARGLDIQGLTHVIQFDPPENADQYIHRSGRTGRSGASGTVISIVAPREERVLKQFSRELNIPVHQKVLYKGKMMDKAEK
ncbi:superfamily II DNA/RNA helicase [Scopulibacillus darangshiensis]|uniref:Superfamily II DNA/RNA helicase n=1 Tax=Scopulibacillus darangshiensis TaxID=442528 RepID=A0A4R2P4V6_9BACL|nr:DEAD/DEAH box helicase [Scopulibacillus darangshiensis]TCP28981.1 superfamily II DNA/RNA helicase [Scopulibacillus darangshiensis]